MEIVINVAEGTGYGFRLSPEAHQKLAAKRNEELYFYISEITKEGKVIFRRLKLEEIKESDFLIFSKKDHGETCPSFDMLEPLEMGWSNDFDRCHPDLISVVKELGKRANWKGSELKIVEIPDDTKWELYDDNGVETIHETHRIWS